MPLDCTLCDYKHASPSRIRFTKELDLELLEVVLQQRPHNLARYVGLVLDEMYVKEGLYFNKHTGELLEQRLNASDTTPRPLGKCMLMFMVRGLFTPLKFPYVQFVAASTKGADVFPLVRQAVKHLTHLGLTVTTITFDGASGNRRMFQMFNSKADLSYKTINVFGLEKREVFISNPPHLLKTICNCFARGKFWVCGCINFMLVYTVLFLVCWAQDQLGFDCTVVPGEYGADDNNSRFNSSPKDQV